LLGAVADVFGDELAKLLKENETLHARLDKLESENIERGSASLHQLRAITAGR